MTRYQCLILASALPWICVGAAQAGSPNAPASFAEAPRAVEMLPLELAASSVPLAPVGLDLWLSVWLPPQVELRKGAGFAMTRPVRVGRTDLQLGVAGPVLRKKNLGLTVEVRF
ncbi:MAG TPA: hypothetical protein VIY27_07140 [Myxococcota bacterium]